jgi:hypothetical protein
MICYFGYIVDLDAQARQKIDVLGFGIGMSRNDISEMLKAYPKSKCGRDPEREADINYMRCYLEGSSYPYLTFRFTRNLEPNVLNSIKYVFLHDNLPEDLKHSVIEQFNLKDKSTFVTQGNAELETGVFISLTFPFWSTPPGFRAGIIEIFSKKLQELDYAEGQQKIKRNSTPQKF